MSTLHSATRGPMGAAILAILAIISGGGCDDDGGREAVVPRIAVVVSDGALSLAAGTLKSANGTFGPGCFERSGAWSVAIADGAPLAHAALSVIKGNTACVLTLTSLTAEVEYAASPPIDMTAVFQPSGSAFGPVSAPVSFYGNARLDALTFSADFVVVILYSADPNVSDSDNQAIFDAATASATASGVPVPNYTINVAQIVVSTDSANVVQSAIGTAALTDGTITGQSYVVVTALASTSFDNVDAAFDAGSQVAISGANPQIAAADFSLTGLDLTVAKFRYVILANTVNDVSSYQVITMTFTAAPL